MSFDPGVLIGNWHLLAQGLGITVLICFASLPLGFVVGGLLAASRLYGGRILEWAVIGYVELFRNVPFLIQIFLLFFGLPFFGIRIDPLPLAIVALAAYAAAYFAEILRAAVLSVDAGQWQAARALGLKTPVVLMRVIVPQTWGFILPASTNMLITLIKESAVLSVITVAELTYMSQFIIGRTFAPVEVFTAVSLLYWGLTASVSAATARIEARLTRHLSSTRA